jgi:putative phage-type endonuclease
MWRRLVGLIGWEQIMAEIIETDSRTQWLKARRKGIGASDIAAIMGVSPWSTPLQVWVSKVTDEAPEVEQTEAMEWGQRLEESIIQAFEDRTGDYCDHHGALWQHDSKGWMLATPDAVIMDDGEEWGVVEAKTTNDWEWDEIPPHYMMQVQWQMATLEVEHGYLAVLHRGRRLEVYEIHPDPELQEAMMTAAEGFWFSFVTTETPPPAEGADNQFLATLYPTSTEKPVEVAPEIVEELRQAKHSMSKAKSRVAAAEAALKEILQDGDTAVVGQEIVATWKTQQRAEYTVPAREFRVLRVRSPKDD